MNKNQTVVDKERKIINYLCQATQKIQGIVQELFDKQNQEQLDNLEFYFYCIGNDIYYNLHRHEYIFNDELDLRDLWCTRYENLHDSIEEICPVLKETRKIPSLEFDKLNTRIYLFLLASSEIEQRLHQLIQYN